MYDKMTPKEFVQYLVKRLSKDEFLKLALLLDEQEDMPELFAEQAAKIAPELYNDQT